MPSKNFYHQEREAQIVWRQAFLDNQQPGWQNRGRYDHVLPANKWELNLWDGIRSELQEYIRENSIQPHTGKHNLCSSWVLCANLYFPFRDTPGLDLLAGFLTNILGLRVSNVRSVELEWEAKDAHLKPCALLGEPSGVRGSGQTSPDVAFEVDMTDGSGIILVESKYTEHWFYQCSGYRARKENPNRPPNKNPEQCKRFLEIVLDPKKCHLTKWNRKYWDFLNPNSGFASGLATCPAVFGGYQLFRQHALAEALKERGVWKHVISAVAYDNRNTELFNFLRMVELPRKGTDARLHWANLFSESVPLVTFTHQQWVQWIRDTATSQDWRSWLKYMDNRYRM